MGILSKALGGYTETAWGWVDNSAPSISSIDGQYVGVAHTFTYVWIGDVKITVQAYWMFAQSQGEKPYDNEGIVLGSKGNTIFMTVSTGISGQEVSNEIETKAFNGLLKLKKDRYSQGSWEYKVSEKLPGFKEAALEVATVTGMLQELVDIINKQDGHSSTTVSDEEVIKPQDEEVVENTPASRKMHKKLCKWYTEEVEVVNTIEERNNLRSQYLQLTDDIEDGVFSLSEVITMFRDGYSVSDILDLVEDDESSIEESVSTSEGSTPASVDALNNLLAKFGK